MLDAKSRGLRDEIYHTYVTCDLSGDLDNNPVVDHILKFRLAKPKLLGYNNYLEV